MTTDISIRHDNDTEIYLRASREGRDGADGGDDGNSRELHFNYLFLNLLKVMRKGGGRFEVRTTPITIFSRMRTHFHVAICSIPRADR